MGREQAIRLGRLGVAAGTGMVVLGVLLWVTAAAGARAQHEADQQAQLGGRQAQRVPEAKGLQGSQGDPGKQDAQRASVIELRFAEDERLSGLGLDAEVRDGVVTLTGTVKSEEERALAEQLAASTGGGRQPGAAGGNGAAGNGAASEGAIDNRITIEPPPPPKSPREERAANEPMTMEEREQLRKQDLQAALRREQSAPQASDPTVGQPAPTSAAPRGPNFSNLPNSGALAPPLGPGVEW